MIQKSTTETPIEEIHRIRREISDRFGGDIAAIAADAQRRAQASGRPFWQGKTTNQAMQRSARWQRFWQWMSQLPPPG